MLSKMEQAKALENKIKEVTKKKDLIDKIVKGFQDNGAKTAPVCIRVNPAYPNYMPLDAEYLPMENEKFIEAYVYNIDTHLSSLKTELESIFN